MAKNQLLKNALANNEASKTLTPVFSAYNGSAQSISGSTATKVQFPTEEQDTGGDFDNATNYRFVAPVAGFYHFNATVHMASSCSDFHMWFAVNGSQTHMGGRATATSQSVVSGMHLAAGDYVEVYMYQTTGSVNTNPGGAKWVRFTGHLVRAD